MAVIADCTVDGVSDTDWASLRVPPGLTVTLERIVPTKERIVPFVWIEGGGREAFVERMRGHPAIADVEVVNEFDDSGLYRIEWEGERPTLLEAVIESEVTLLDAVGTREGWSFQIRADERGGIRSLNDYCTEHDIPLEILRIYNPEEMRAVDRYGLTAEQTETLRAAYAAGYFDEPRTATLEEVAEEFEVTPRAVSRRLRRGLKNLLEHTVAR